MDASVHPHARGDDLIFLLVLGLDVRFTPTRVGTIRHFWPLPNPPTGSPPHAWGRSGSRRPGCHGAPVHPHTRGDDHHPQPRSGLKYRFTPTRVGTILKRARIYGTRTRKSPSKSSTDRAVFPQLRIRNPCS